MGHITDYINQFGYIVLFVALLLELIALPLPGEVLMVYSGFLVFQGQLNWTLSILVAGIGACAGMTISYWVGNKLGIPFFEKYGRKFHMGRERIEKTSHWYSKYGNKLLVIAYFIPGVRHITGYFSGITRLPFRTFALFAYSGAFLWTAVFITLGKILGPQWDQFHTLIKKYLIIGGVVAASALIIIYIYKKYKDQLTEVALRIKNMALEILHFLNRFKTYTVWTAMISLGLIISWLFNSGIEVWMD
ncbi:DedA family protein [Neobacillus soli]|uniref:DedA family protein n=1 Tax=Neobacillus soli TaxID=220688 RepID=UPI000826C8B1|nr:DedA family protein [Neobacillus soli]